jgi:hypothetical protein
MYFLSFIKQCLVFVLLCFILNAFAAPDVFQKEHFQYKAEIAVDTSTPMQMIEIPEFVQSKLYFHDARDIRVYNADGELVPSIVKFEGNKSAASIIKKLSFYPINPDGTELIFNASPVRDKNIALNIEVNVNSEKQSNNKTNTNALVTPQIYIIENPLYTDSVVKDSFASGVITELMIDWEYGFEGIASVNLMTSDDLHSWRILISNDNVADMRFKNRQLHKDTLNVANKAGRYIKLTWLDKQRPIIKGIKARFGQQVVKPNYVWSENLTLQRAEEENITHNTFDTKVSPAFHTDRFRILSKQSNQIYTGVIKTRASEKQQWLYLTGFQFYQVDIEKGRLNSLEQSIGSNNHFLWRIYFQYPQQLDVNRDVALQVNRYPLRLYFLKQGKAPFYLAYSSDSIDRQPEELTHVVTQLLKNTDLHYGNAIVGQPQIVEPEIIVLKPLVDWKKLTLWLVLVLGVMVMLFMAKSLLRQMTTE